MAAPADGLAGVRGGKTIADIGCGNGHYLAELARHSQAGPGAVFRVRTRSGCLVAA
jgi:ubiquinone/menaquinone biosynthesis C-methylase UbiE